MARDYTDYPALSGIYLEDSYVLDIVEEPGGFRFVLEAVLTPERPNYRNPISGEQYCYVEAELIFTNVSAVEWLDRSDRRSGDATGTEDLGNIDALTWADGVYSAEGDWGIVRIRSSTDPEFVVSARDCR
ncbi:hypothetical protein [Nocardia inohanensis]|uniref:hypothetical protein n=1 Tax=Nocardia inohanensis TaxID=209246 RepID=UPI00082EA523|nr:hypothetical protein [Nocardia inohanensis]